MGYNENNMNNMNNKNNSTNSTNSNNNSNIMRIIAIIYLIDFFKKVTNILCFFNNNKMYIFVLATHVIKKTSHMNIYTKKKK